MWIKNNFITNDSSISFILGKPESNDTVDTIYNLFRMTAFEIYFIIDNVKNEIKNNELYKDFKFVLTYYKLSNSFLYNYYSKDKIINDLFLKYYNNSFFSACCKKFEADLIDLLKFELVEPTLDFESILNNVTYNQYKENFIGIELLDLSEVNDKNNLMSYLKKAGYNYFLEHENINNYTDFYNKVELMDIVEIRNYLRKLGSVFVISKYNNLGKFKPILQSFFRG